MYRKPVIILALLTIACSICDGDHSISNFNAGSANLQIAAPQSSGQSRTSYSHNFQQTMSSLPSVAFGIQNSVFSAASAAQFGQFEVTVGQVTRQSVSFIFDYKNTVWRSIRINFWASSREDIVAGTSSINLGSLRDSSSVSRVDTALIPNSQRSIVRSFLNGFSLNSDSLGLSIEIEASIFQSNAISMKVVAGPQTDINKVAFSYIIFSPPTVPFASYGGMVAQSSFSGIGYKGIQNIVQAPLYPIMGIVKINSAFSASFNVDLDSDFVLTYSVPGSAFDFGFSYVLIGAPPRTLCSQCSQAYSLDTTCVAACPSSTFPYKYGDGGLACLRCSPKLNWVLNAQGNGCDCFNGFSKDSKGNCVRVQASAGFGSAGFGSANTPTTVTTQTSGQSISVENRPSVPTVPTIPSISTTPTVTVNPINEGNSYIATPQEPNYPPSIQATIPNPVQSTTAESCSSFSNTYWTGYRCACRVGYKFEVSSGTCIKITISIPDVIIPIEPPVTVCPPNEYFNNIACICINGYTRNSQGICSNEISCPAGTTWDGVRCVSDIICPDNSYLNAAKECICNAGYYKEGGICINGEPCVPYSTRLPSGVCICNEGYFQTPDGYCSRCQEGAVWLSGECVYVCGVNEVHNPSTKQCECKEGYGRGAVCMKCVSPYFLKDGYCVTCPINHVYNSAAHRCDCATGYTESAGKCIPACNENQVFDVETNRCKCYQGLGFHSNGECGICPGNQLPNSETQVCGGCGQNEVLSGGVCLCASGFGRQGKSSCVRCEDSGAYLLDGYCVVCPNGKQWDQNSCVCPSGKKEVDGVCQETCNAGQLVDSQGYCYSCPLNQEPKDGVCVCKSGFVQTSANQCEIQCQKGQVIIKGRCAVCVLNTQYDPVNQVCVCRDGSYLNENNVCATFVVPPIQCEDGFYLDSTQGCRSCPTGCKTCDSATICTSCTDPTFGVINGNCRAKCGNGLKQVNEGCDDGDNQNGDGCSASCVVEGGYNCYGTHPSYCSPGSNKCGDGKVDSGEGCDDKNNNSGDGCSNLCKEQAGYTCSVTPPATHSVCSKGSKGLTLQGEIHMNSGSVYAAVKTDPTFVFDSEQEMTNFLKYKFSNSAEPTAAYCKQRPTDLSIFECLFLYPYGVPLFEFNVQLSYDHQGKQGYLSFPVIFSNGAFATRSLR